MTRAGSLKSWRHLTSDDRAQKKDSEAVLGVWLGLYKIFIYFKAFMHERIILFLPLPICIAHTIAIRLHDDCAIHDPPPTPLLNAMHHTQLVSAISCKGQRVAPRALTIVASAA